MKIVLLTAAGALALATSAPALTQAAAPAAAPAAGKAMTRAGIATMVQRQFARIDANRDGYVTAAEAQAAAANRAAVRQQRAGARPDRFARLDVNKDGMLSRAEFEAKRNRAGSPGMRHRGKGAMRMHGMSGQMLTMADANKDGRVSLQEATAMAVRHFDSADTNRDCTVTREERRQMHRTMRNAPAR